jgi:osmotically-inducible protein OsmY
MNAVPNTRRNQPVARTDDEIKAELVREFIDDPAIPDAAIRIDVEDGRVILAGDVDWEHERDAAETRAKRTAGVRAVINEIRVVPKASPRESW